MVKKAEDVKKRGVLVPIFGLITAVGLFGIAYYFSYNYIVKMDAIKGKLPGAMITATGTGTLVFAVGIWLVFLAIAFFVVSLLVGKDPDDARQVKLPPREKDLPKSQRRTKYTRR